MSLRRPIVLASVVAAGTFAGAAFAYVCHPTIAGTRMLAVRGSVVSLQAHGATFDLVLKTGGGRCAGVTWNAASGSSQSVRVACSTPARLQTASTPLLPALAAGPAAQRVVVARGTGLQPDVLKVYGADGALRRTLPLPARPQTLQSTGGIAVFSARGQGVFAMRLSDGLFGYLGPDGGSFSPVLDAKGVLFHDGESKAALRGGTTIVEYVPRPAVMRIIARTAKPLVTGGPIRAISMDGPRVALAVGDTQGRCDRVLYWNVAWWPAQRVSAPSGVDLPRPASRRADLVDRDRRLQGRVADDADRRGAAHRRLAALPGVGARPLLERWCRHRARRRRGDPRLRRDDERPHDRLGGRTAATARSRSRRAPARRGSRSTARGSPSSGRTAR